MPIVVSAIIGGIVGWIISIPIFGIKGGKQPRPGVIEFDLAKGDVPPGGCPKSLANVVFIQLDAIVDAVLF